MVESEEEESFDSEVDMKSMMKTEVDMKSMMKTLALITKEYNRGFRRPSYRGKYERENR